MTYDQFVTSLNQDSPPLGLSDLLQALWLDGKGDWEGSHNIVQELDSSMGAVLHGYLHRKEGDLGNARYWYAAGGRKLPTVSLREEWQLLVRELVAGLAKV